MSLSKRFESTQVVGIRDVLGEGTSELGASYRKALAYLASGLFSGQQTVVFWTCGGVGLQTGKRGPGYGGICRR